MTTPDGIALFGVFMVLSGVIAPIVGVLFWNSARKQLLERPARYLYQ